MKTNDAVTISFLVGSVEQQGFDVLIPNFERVYPNIKVDVTYAPSTAVLYQLETTELAAGNGPDLLTTFPGCGQPVSVCALAKAGDLAPMIKKPWVKRSLPLVTSLSKYGQGLFAFEPTVGPDGVFANDDLFAKLGLKVPQTFAQLLAVCQKAKSAGTVAVLLPGADATTLALTIVNLAIATVYASDPHFTAEQKAGKVTFDGSTGWHRALQEFVDMNDAACFQPGATGAAIASAYGAFAQGQGLMTTALTTRKGTIDMLSPAFTYGHYPFPGGTAPNQTTTFLNLGGSVSVNAHASAQNQSAAQTFVDFLARPKQNTLFAQLVGGLTQYEFLKDQIPDFMSGDSAVLEKHEYVVSPVLGWWNANVFLALQQDAIGLITGQSSVDDILNAMDAAWKQGPS